MTRNCTVLVTVDFYPWNETPWEWDAVKVLCLRLLLEREWPWLQAVQGLISPVHQEWLWHRCWVGSGWIYGAQGELLSIARGCFMQALPKIATWEFDMHCFFCWWKENDLSSYSRCVFHIFPSVRHLYHTQLSPLALLVITCLLLSAVVILGGFLLVFWVVCFLLNHSNLSKIALLAFFPYPFFYGLVLGWFFFWALYKKQKPVCDPCSEKLYFMFFYFCTHLVVHFCMCTLKITLYD